MAPAGTPQPVLEKISAEISRILNEPAVRDRLATQGVVTRTSRPTEFSELIARDTARLAPLFADAGLN